MSDNPADAITDDLIAKSRDGFDSLAQEIERVWKARISVPVEGSGRNAIRSRPGEDPRKEHGDYYESITHTSSVEGDTLHAAAGSNMLRALWLQEGTSRMKPRPHADKVADEMGGVVVSSVAEIFADATK